MIFFARNTTICEFCVRVFVKNEYRSIKIISINDCKKAMVEVKR